MRAHTLGVFVVDSSKAFDAVDNEVLMNKQSYCGIISTQCGIQSYFEAGIPIWNPKLRIQPGQCS